CQQHSKWPHLTF
nr:immunoglobulin light chain junction region [Macaca mulatta]